MGIHFKTDVFAAVAIVNAKAPYYRDKGRGHDCRLPSTMNVCEVV